MNFTFYPDRTNLFFKRKTAFFQLAANLERQLTPEHMPMQDTQGFQRNSSKYSVFWSLTGSL